MGVAKEDLLQMIAPEARASAWSKWYFWPFMRPLISRLAREGILPRTSDAELRNRISTFLRSRWLKPPLYRKSLSNLLLDGIAAMEVERPSVSKQLHPGVRHDLHMD